LNILVTGGAGFIGSNFIRYILNNDQGISITNLDKLTYAGNLENLFDVEDKYSERYNFHHGDICDKLLVKRLIRENNIESIVNFAAETHVDRSIIDSDAFIRTNVIGTKTLLDAALDADLRLFVQISTDEVYGSLGQDGKFSEESRVDPNSPYSASKAAADHIAKAYFKTYNLPVLIARCSNNYGSNQFPEKLIPILITNAVENKPLPIYGTGKNIRDWVYVDDHSSAIEIILKNGKAGEVYNIGGDCELENLTVAEMVLDFLSKPRSLITFVKDRPGHDLRYAMDFTKLKTELGWSPAMRFETGLQLTIDWYLKNQDWVAHVFTKEYLDYYEQNYGSR